MLGICALHLTHPSAHTSGAVGSQCCGTRGAVGGSDSLSTAPILFIEQIPKLWVVGLFWELIDLHILCRTTDCILLKEMHSLILSFLFKLIMQPFILPFILSYIQFNSLLANHQLMKPI